MKKTHRWLIVFVLIILALVHSIVLVVIFTLHCLCLAGKVEHGAGAQSVLKVSL